MRSFVIAGLVLALVSTAAAAQQASTDPKQAPTGRYALETRHSELLFAIAHQGLTDYYGRFDKLSGTLNYDSAQPEKSVVSISIDMDSIDTPAQALIPMLKAVDVFDAQKFPAATFVSTSIVRTGPTTGKITGNLTIRDVTHPVTLDVTFGGTKLDAMSDAHAVGFHATATIRRTDFHLTGMRWAPFVGDDVKLIIEALFQQQKG